MFLNKKLQSALLVSCASLLCLAMPSASYAQDWHGGDRGGPPMERAFHGGEHGRWWDNPHLAQQIGLTDEQKNKMDDIFEQTRLQLIDLNAALQKQEAIMQPLVEADQPDENKILSQIDSIAQARASLEKAHAKMLFEIREILTPDQWKKVKAMAHNGPPRMGSRRGEWRNGGPRQQFVPNKSDGSQPQPPPPSTPSNE